MSTGRRPARAMSKRTDSKLDREIAKALVASRPRRHHIARDMDDFLTDLARKFWNPQFARTPKVRMAAKIPRGTGSLIDLDADEGQEDIEDFAPDDLLYVGHVFFLPGSRRDDLTLIIPPMDEDAFMVAVDAVMAGKPISTVRSAIKQGLQDWARGRTRELYLALAMRRAQELAQRQEQVS